MEVPRCSVPGSHHFYPHFIKYILTNIFVKNIDQMYFHTSWLCCDAWKIVKTAFLCMVLQSRNTLLICVEILWTQDLRVQPLSLPIDFFLLFFCIHKTYLPENFRIFWPPPPCHLVTDICEQPLKTTATKSLRLNRLFISSNKSWLGVTIVGVINQSWK